MAQVFQYPNLVSGTRDHISLYSFKNFVRPVALAAAPGGLAYALANADVKENFMWTSLADLRNGKTYALSLWMASTDNCASTDIFAIDTEDGHYDAIAVVNKVKPPSVGGGGTHGHSLCQTATATARESTTACASTTTGARTAGSQRSTSRTSCSWRARSRTHGHRRQGRCGRR